MQTGSLINSIMMNSKHNIPEVGMGATVCMWSDRQAATISAVSSKLGANGLPTWFETKGDKATRTDSNGMSESQSYTYEPNPAIHAIRWTLRKNGRYTRLGTEMGKGDGILIGHRETYYDYSF